MSQRRVWARYDGADNSQPAEKAMGAGLRLR
jgi:hypothetical protein